MSVADVLRSLRSGERSFSREVVETFATNLAVTGLGVVTGILVARLLGPVGRGELAAIQALPSILGALGMLGLHDAVIYFGSKDRGHVGTYIASATALILLISVPVVAAGALLMPRYLNEQSAEVIRASQIYLMILYVNAIAGIAISTSRALHDIRLWNRLRLIGPGLWLVVVVLFFALGAGDAGRLASVYILLFTVASMLSVLSVRSAIRGRFRPRIDQWRRLLAYGLPSAAGTMPQLVGQQLDQLLIAGMFPPKQLGLYAVAASWSMLARLPGTAMAGVAFSKIAAMTDASAQRAFIRRSVLTTALITIVLASVLGVAAPILIPLVFTSAFRDSVPLALILLGASSARMISLMLQFCMKGVGLPSTAMYAEWSGLATMFVGLALLVPRYGVFGAAWASAAFGVVSLVVAVVIVRRWARGVR